MIAKILAIASLLIAVACITGLIITQRILLLDAASIQTLDICNITNRIDLAHANRVYLASLCLIILLIFNLATMGYITLWALAKRDYEQIR